MTASRPGDHLHALKLPRHGPNDFCCGLKMLALLPVANELATAYADSWLERFDSDAGAAAELKLRQTRREQLAAGAALSLDDV